MIVIAILCIHIKFVVLFSNTWSVWLSQIAFFIKKKVFSFLGNQVW